MNTNTHIKNCGICKHFFRHYTIADSNLTLLETDIGTCKCQYNTHNKYLKANNSACELFEICDPSYSEDEIINQLKSTAKNLDILTWILKEKRKKRN